MQEKFEVNGFPINDCVTGTVLPAGGSNKHLSSSFLLWLAYLSTKPSSSFESSRVCLCVSFRDRNRCGVTIFNPTLV